jgi:hypothetical protein
MANCQYKRTVPRIQLHLVLFFQPISRDSGITQNDSTATLVSTVQDSFIVLPQIARCERKSCIMLLGKKARHLSFFFLFRATGAAHPALFRFLDRGSGGHAANIVHHTTCRPKRWARSGSFWSGELPCSWSSSKGNLVPSTDVVYARDVLPLYGSFSFLGLLRGALIALVYEGHSRARTLRIALTYCSD